MLSKYTMTMPTPKQTAFLLLDGFQEVMYGGAAGGGKSEALLQAASQHLETPGYSALLLRRSFKNLSLPGALMDRSHQWWSSTDARWDGNDHKWIFPSGATIQFGYLEKENDHLQYQSAEFQFIGFDELTQFPERHYTYLFSRLRRLRTMSHVPLRIRAATNPGGPGHEWVRERYNLPHGPQPENEDMLNRAFVPARLEDNPYLDQEEYEKAFAELSELTRKQLREGDWDAGFGGGRFYPHGNMELTQLGDWEPKNFSAVVRFWDMAATEPSEGNPDPDYTVGVKLGKTIFGRKDRTEPDWVVLDVVRDRKESAGVDALVRGTAARDGPSVPQWFEQERGSAGKLLIGHYRNNLLPGYEVHGLQVTGDKETRATEVAGRVNEGGRVFAIEADWNRAFYDELTVFNEGNHDDQVDALSGAFYSLERIGAMKAEGDGRVKEY